MNTINKSFIIRKAQHSDLEDVLKVQFKAFHVHTQWLASDRIPPLNETFDGVKKAFQNKVILVAVRDEKIVGSIRYYIKTGVCFLERLAVDPACQKQGIGSALVQALEKQARGKAHKIYLETGLLAEDLIKFYSKLGYSGEAVLKKHYGNFDWLALSKFMNRE